jgi:hypothetical protein
MYTAFDPETIDAAFGDAGATIFNSECYSALREHTIENR